MSNQSDRIRAALSRSDVSRPSGDPAAPTSGEERAEERVEDVETTRPSIAINDENLAALLRPESTPRKPVFEVMEEVESALSLLAASDETRAATPRPEASALVAQPAGPVTKPATPVTEPATPATKPLGPADPDFAVSELAPEKFQEPYPSFGTGTTGSKPSGMGRTPLILGAVIVIAGLSSYLLWNRWTPAPKHTAPTPVATFPLQLELQPQGNGLINIRWNPGSPLVTQAREGRMVITERDQPPKTVALGPEQLKIGHLYFQSSADRVEFRLEVVDRSGGVSQESAMALSSGAPAPDASPQGGASQSSAVKTPNTPGTAPNAVAAQSTAQPKPAIRTFTIPPPARPSAEEGRVILPEPPPVVAGESTTPAPAVRLPDAGGTPPQARLAPQQVKVGGEVQSANLIRRVTPVYPELAKKARVQGTVRFSAVIGKGGTIQDLQLVSGPPMLVQAAVNAVKQWVYRPTLLNGEPVEVVTQIDVNFSLSQ